MRKVTEKEVARMLAARATPEPPAGLADRIKADIPGSIRVERPALQSSRRWLLPPIVEGLQPSWLAAASVLFVLGVGIVAARIPTKPDEVWKWMALSGVVHIDDIVVTAPAPVDSDRPVLAAAKAAPVRAAEQPRSRAAEGGADERIARVAAARPRPAEAGERSGPAVTPRGEVAADATAAAVPGAGAEREAAAESVPAEPEAPAVRVAQATSGRMRDAAAGGVPAPSTLGRVSALAAQGAAECRNCLTFVVVDAAGAPVPGATVTLERIGQGGTWSLSARADAFGAAAFRGLSLSMYHVVVTAPAYAPAQSVVTVTSATSPTRTEVRLRPEPRR